MNTIDGMQNEKYFYGHYNEFVYNHDFEQVFKKIVFDLLEFGVLDSNIYFKIDFFIISNIIINDIVIIFSEIYYFDNSQILY